MAALDEIEAWLALADQVRSTAPPGTAESSMVGTVTVGSYGWQTRHVDDRGAPVPADDSRQRYPELGELAALAGPRGACFELRADAGGRVLVDVFEVPASMDVGSGDEIELALVPEALPAHYRREAVPAPDEALPAEELDALRALLAAHPPGGTPATEEQLAEIEAGLGVPLPEDVRLLYRTSGSGELIVGGEDDPFYGFEIVPLDDAATRRSALPAGRFPGWRFADLDELPADGGPVQPVAGSAFWFVVGHDWGGNYYAIDLAPGPNGRRGQVVLIDHESNLGAIAVAPSLGALLRDGEQPVAWPDRGAVVRINRGTTDAPAALVTPSIESVSISTPPAPVDLAPLLGRPEIRALRASAGGLADLRQLAELPGLEYVELDLADWVRVLDAELVPPGLLAATVTSAGETRLSDRTAVANRLLGRWHRPLIELTRLETTRPATGPTEIGPPETGPPAATTRP